MPGCRHRTYDTASPLVIPQTLERIQSLIQLAQPLPFAASAGGATVICNATAPLTGGGGGEPTVCTPPPEREESKRVAAADRPGHAGRDDHPGVVLVCPTGQAITQILFADYGEAAGTCAPARSPDACVAEAARWCRSCPQCLAFDTLFSESASFHGCSDIAFGNNWDLYLRNESFARRHPALKVDDSGCAAGTPKVLPGMKCNANRTSGVFAPNPACSAPNATGVVERLCLGQHACTVPGNDPELFGGPPCGGGTFRLAVKALCAPPPPAAAADDSASPTTHGNPTARGEAFAAGGLPAANRGLINGDAEGYPAVALGAAFGIMRGNTETLRPFPDMDGQTGWDLNATGRHIKFRVDEVSRAVRWQRIAPPFGVREPRGAQIAVDGSLVDSWRFRPGETWYSQMVGSLVSQGAPARIARGGMALPEVRRPAVTGAAAAAAAGSLLPYVVACRYPAGAVSVTSLGRVSPYPVGYTHPLADVSVVVDWLDATGGLPAVGVFGRYHSLTVTLLRPPTGTGTGAVPLAQLRIWGQDLLSDGPPTDITANCTIRLGAGPTDGDNADSSIAVVVPGGVIDRVGTAEATRPSDVSDPGLVLSISL